MTFRHGKLTEVVLDDFIASPYLNSASTPKTIEVSDTSAFGTQDKTYIVGMNDGTMSLAGMFDGTVGAIDELFNELTAIEGNYPATLFYDGGIKPGRSVRFGSVKQTTYDISSPVGEVVSLSVELQCNGGIKSGKALTDNQQRNASIIHTSVDWGANSATTRGGTLNVHVPHNGRNTATTVTLQHSSDNSVWVDIATQNVSAGQTAAFVVPVVGAVDRYVRANINMTDGTGLINVIAAFARN